MNMKIFNCLIIYFVIILFGCTPKSMNMDNSLTDSNKNKQEELMLKLNPSKNKEDILKSIKNDKHRHLLSQFIDSCGKDDNISITEHEHSFEIIIDHPSYADGKGNRYTGGAEQYILDKKTGKIGMGWHEHPMKLPDGF